MSWKPTEGMKRAEPLVRLIAEEGAANNNIIGPLLQWRMISLIAGALEDALQEAKPLSGTFYVVDKVSASADEPDPGYMDSLVNGQGQPTGETSAAPAKRKRPSRQRNRKPKGKGKPEAQETAG